MYTSFERSVNAKKQLRDKYGKWIFMGGRARWFDALSNLFRSGKVIDISPTDVTIRETSTGKSYKVPRGSVEAITAKASLGDHSKPQSGESVSIKSVQPGVYELTHNNNPSTTVDRANVAPGARVYGTVDVDGTSHAPYPSDKIEVTDGTVWTLTGGNTWVSDAGQVEHVPLGETVKAQHWVKESDAVDDQIASLNDTVKADLDDQSEPTNIDSWKKVQNLGGSTGAALYEDENGNKYVVKFPEEEKAKNEILANRLYALLGIQTPDTELITQNGKLGISSPFLPNQGEISEHMGDADVKEKMKAGFVPDAWLANWDFAGLTNDNIVITDDGVPVRVDNGGALIYRAQGAPKGNAFGNTVGELDTLRTSPQGKQFYGKMTDEEISASAAPVVNVTDEQIDQLVDSVDFKPAVAASVKARLKARRDDIKAKVPVSPAQQTADDLAATLDKQAPTPYTGVPTDQADMPEQIKGETDVISNLQAVLAKIQENQDNPQPVDIKAVAPGSILTSSPGGIAGTGHWVKNMDGSFTYHNTFGQPVGEAHFADQLVGKFYLSGHIGDTDLPKTTGGGKFQILEDTGKNGDGYHSSGPWGKYGAAGVLIQAPNASDTPMYLLVQRGPSVSSNKGKWQLPGGALNSKEDAYQGTARETHEELGTSQGYLNGLSPVGEIVFDNGKGWQYTNITANAPEQFVPNVDGTETGDAKWLTKEQILDMADKGQLHPSLAGKINELFDTYSPTAPDTQVVHDPDVDAPDEDVNAPEKATLEPDAAEKQYNFGDVIAVDDSDFYHEAPVGTVILQEFGNGGSYYYRKTSDNTWIGWNGVTDEESEIDYSDDEVFESYADEPPVTTLVTDAEWPGDVGEADQSDNTPLAQWEKELLYGDKFIEGTVLGKTSEEAISAAPKNTVIHEQYTDGSADSYYKKVGDNLWAVSGGDDPQNLFHISDEEVAGETSDNGKITHEVVPASQWPVKGIEAAEPPAPAVETPPQQVTPYTPGRLPNNLSVNWYSNAPEGTVVHETSTKDTGEYYFKKNANGGWSTWSVDANGPTNPNYLSSGMAKSGSQSWLEHSIVDPSEWPAAKPATPEPTPEAAVDIDNAPSGATTQLGDNPDQFFTSNGDGTWTSSWLPESSPLHTISSADLENAAIISGKSPVINLPGNAAQPDFGDDYTPGLSLSNQDATYFANAPIGTIIHETTPISKNEFYYKKVDDNKWEIYNVNYGYQVNTFNDSQVSDEVSQVNLKHTIAEPSAYPPDQLNPADTDHPVEPDAPAHDYTVGASAKGHGVEIYEDAPVGTVIFEQNGNGSAYYYKKLGTNNWALYNAKTGGDYNGDTLSDADVYGEANYNEVTHTFAENFPPDIKTKPPLPSSNSTFEPSDDYSPGKPIPDEVTVEWLNDAPPGTTIYEEWEDGTEYYYHKGEDGEWSYFSVNDSHENQYAPHMVAGDMNSEDSTHSLVEESQWPGSMPESDEPAYGDDDESYMPGESAKGYDVDYFTDAPSGTVILADNGMYYTKNDDGDTWTLSDDKGVIHDANYSSIDVESDASADGFAMSFGLPEDVPQAPEAPAPQKPALPTDSPRTPDGLNVGDPIHGDQKVYADLPVGTKLGAVNGQTQGGWTKVGPNLWELKHVDGGTGVATNHQMSGKASALYPFYMMPSEPTTLETTNYLPGDKVFGGANVYTGLPTGIRISGSPNSPYGAWQKIADDHWEFDHGSSVESSDDAGMADKASSSAPFYVQKPKANAAPQAPTSEPDENAPKDANGTSLAVGDIINGGKGETGKIEAFPLGGKSAKVTTPDGQTKFWKLDKATKADTTELPEASTKYAVLQDANGDEYVNDVYANPVYVGDTVVSSGKTGFTGEVVALKPGGTVVIVKDPVDGKNKPRNVNKITKVSGKDAPAAVEATPQNDSKPLTPQEIKSLSEGDEVHTIVNGQVFNYAMNDGYWQDDEGGYISEDDLVHSPSAIYPGPGPEFYAPSYEDGDAVSPYDLEKFGPGTSVHMNTSTGTYTYTKNENGEWFYHESNDTIDNELLAEGDVDGNPTLYGPAPGASAKPPLEAEAPSYKNGDVVPATTEAFDALPAGTVVHHKDEDGMTMDYIKKSNGTWVSEADSIYTAEDMADPNMPINYGAADDSPITSYAAGEKIEPKSSVFDGLPVGTTVTSDLNPEGTPYHFTKGPNGNWIGHYVGNEPDYEASGWDNYSMADPDEPMYYVSGPDESNAVAPSPEPTTTTYAEGTAPSSVDELKAAPIGTTLQHTIVKSSAWTKTGPDEWSNANGITTDSSGFFYAATDTSFKYGAPAQNIPEAPAAPQGTDGNVVEGQFVTEAEADAAPVGAQLKWADNSGFAIYTKQADGSWTFPDANGNEITASQIPSAAGNKILSVTNPDSWNNPSAQKPELPNSSGTDLTPGEAIPVNDDDIWDNFPVGTVVTSQFNNTDSVTYVKQANGKWMYTTDDGVEHPYMTYDSSSMSDPNDPMILVSLPDEQAPQATGVGQTITDWDKFQNLPVGSTVQYNNAPANSGLNVDWIKTGPNQWTAADGNATSSSDGFYNSVNTGKLTLTNIGPTTAPETTPKPKVGDMPSSEAELDAAPIGTVLKSTISSSSYTKTGTDAWTNDQYNGTVVSSEGFFLNGKTTFTYDSIPDESPTPTPAPVQQAATPQPSGPAAVGENGKGYSVGDTVTHPVKGQTGVVVDIKPMPPSKTGGDASVVTIQTPDGKKYKYQARFLNLEKAAQPQATAPQQIVGPTPQDVDNAPIGSTLYFPGVNNTWTKNADGLWQNGPSGEIKKDNPSSYWKMQNATLTHPGGASTASIPTGKVTSTQQLTDAPVGTQMVNKYGSTYVKTGPNEWHAIVDNGGFGTTAFTDSTFGGEAIQQGAYEFNGMYKVGTPAAPTPTPTPTPAPVVHPTGLITTNKQVVDAPVGTTIAHSSGNTYTKIGPNTWKFTGSNGTDEDFTYSDDEFTDYTLKGGKYSYGPFDEKVATNAPAATPTAPKKKTARVNPDSPWFEQPEPTAPVQEETEKTSWVPDGFLAEIQSRYKQKIRKEWTKDEVEQSSKWNLIQQAINNGNVADINSLHKSKFISDEMKDKTLAHIANVKTIKEAEQAEFAAKYAKYIADKKEWREANGLTSGANFNDFPEVSTENFTGGPADWTKAHAGTHSAASVFEKIKTNSDLATHGVSVATDAGEIEDLDVNFTRVIGSDGQQKILAKFKLTGVASDALMKNLDSDWTTESGTYITSNELDPTTGLVMFGSGKKTTWSGKTHVYEANGVRIEISRAQTTTSHEPITIHNQVRVFMPATATEADYQAALEKIGIAQATPATEEAIKNYAINRVVNVMGGYSNPIKQFTQAEIDKTLNDLKVKYGLDVADIRYSTDESGYTRLYLPDAVTDEIIKQTKITGFKHNFYHDTNILAVLTHPKSGILPTYVRWQEGISKGGMSSSADMNGGSGGNYIYTKPVSSDGWGTTAFEAGKINQYDSDTAVLHPKAIARRIDLYGNSGDNGHGQHYTGSNLYKLMSSSSTYEIQIKNGVSLADMWYITTSKQKRLTLIQQLEDRGFTEINGIPIEDFIITSGMPIPHVDASQWSTAAMAVAEQLTAKKK